jgi:hypothetical protein
LSGLSSGNLDIFKLRIDQFSELIDYFNSKQDLKLVSQAAIIISTRWYTKRLQETSLLESYKLTEKRMIESAPESMFKDENESTMHIKNFIVTPSLIIF